MPEPKTMPVLVVDGHDNEVVYPSIAEGVAGLRTWFNDTLEASCQGLSDEGIDELFPGLLARLHEAVASVPAPPLELDPFARYANAIAEQALVVCRSDDERTALGVPTRFSVRVASKLEVPDLAALAELARNRR